VSLAVTALAACGSTTGHLSTRKLSLFQGSAKAAGPALYPQRPATYVLDGPLADLGPSAPVRQLIGHDVTTADLARINKLHEDDELEEGQALKIPNPFEASQRSLEAQVEQLSEQTRANEQKIEQAQSQVAALTNSNSELTAQNATLKESVKVLPC